MKVDEDNPTSLTGPSYRGTAHTGAAAGKDGRQGRMIGPGQSSTSSRGLSATRVAQATAPKGALPSFQEKLVAREQESAERTASELTRSFAATFAARGSTAASAFSRPISIKVLTLTAFKDARAREDERQWLDTLTVLIGAARHNFLRKFERAQRAGSLTHAYASPPATLAELKGNDRAVILQPPGAGRVRGFWASAEQTLYLKLGHWDGGHLAHEMCHAYASSNWDAVEVLLAAWDMGVEGSNIDEGVTSALANLVLKAWLRLPASVLTLDSSRPFKDALRAAAVSDGYGDYPIAKRLQAERFCTVFDSDAEPGMNTMRAYFAGDIRLRIVERRLRASELTVGRLRVTLDKVLYR